MTYTCQKIYQDGWRRVFVRMGKKYVTLYSPWENSQQRLTFSQFEELHPEPTEFDPTYVMEMLLRLTAVGTILAEGARLYEWMKETDAI
jgi:hypothetical protein